MNLNVRVVEGIDGPVVLGAFCPTCQVEALPHDRDGTCLFCDTVIYRAADPPPPPPAITGYQLARERIEQPQFDRQSLMDTLNDVAADLGRTPFKREWERFGFSPSARTYIRRFGSWSAACTAAGLDAA